MKNIYKLKTTKALANKIAFRIRLKLVNCAGLKPRILKQRRLIKTANYGNYKKFNNQNSTKSLLR